MKGATAADDSWTPLFVLVLDLIICSSYGLVLKKRETNTGSNDICRQDSSGEGLLGQESRLLPPLMVPTDLEKCLNLNAVLKSA